MPPIPMGVETISAWLWNWLTRRALKIHFPTFKHVDDDPQIQPPRVPHFMSCQEGEGQHLLDVSENWISYGRGFDEFRSTIPVFRFHYFVQNITWASREPNLTAPPYGTLKAWEMSSNVSERLAFPKRNLIVIGLFPTGSFNSSVLKNSKVSRGYFFQSE